MNFEIKRLADVKMILRVFSLWIFIQVIRDIGTYSVLMHINPASIIWQVAEATGYRRTIANVFALCTLAIIPYFVSTLCGMQTAASKRFGRISVAALFIVFLMWILLIPQVFKVPAAGWYIIVAYLGNAVEAVALSTAFAWNINQYMKYELDYGLIQRIPPEYQIA